MNATQTKVDRFHRLVSASRKLFNPNEDYVNAGERLAKGGGLALLSLEELLVIQNQIVQEVLDRQGV